MKPADRRWYRDGRYQYEVDVAHDGAQAANAWLWGLKPVQCDAGYAACGLRCQRPKGHVGHHEDRGARW